MEVCVKGNTLKAVEDPRADSLKGHQDHHSDDSVAESPGGDQGTVIKGEERHLDEELKKKIVELLHEEVLCVCCQPMGTLTTDIFWTSSAGTESMWLFDHFIRIRI